MQQFEEYHYHLSAFHRSWVRANMPREFAHYEKLHRELKTLSDPDDVAAKKEEIRLFIKDGRLKGARRPDAGPPHDPHEFQSERQQLSDIEAAYAAPADHPDLVALADIVGSREEATIGIKRPFNLGTRAKL